MVNIAIDDLTITSLDEFIFFDPTSGDLQCVLDELQTSKIANTQEEEEITGAGGRLLNTLKKNKATTVSGTNGLVSGGLLSLQTGGEFENKESTPVLHNEYLTITGNTATTTYKAVGTTGNEIDQLYIRNGDTSLGTKLTQNSATSEKNFTYDPKTKTITFADGAYPDGTVVVVYYMRNVKGSTLANYSTTYSKKSRLYVNAQAEDRCANVYRIQFYFPLVDFTGNFDIDMGDNQAVHNFEAKALATSAICAGGTGLASGMLWTYTVFDVNAGDAA